ncbi:hypothetical protein ACTFIW_003801 [Dictyostelium discoideum]
MGYFQVLINSEHSKYTAFITHIGKFKYLLTLKRDTVESNDPFTKRQNNYMKYIKEFDYELRHISGKNNEQINSQWLLEMKKNPNLCIEQINDICYLSEDGFKKFIIKDKETIHTVIREYHDTKYSGLHSYATCQLNINRKDNGILQSLEIPFEVWRNISIDFLSLPKTMYALNGLKFEVDQVCVIVKIKKY